MIKYEKVVYIQIVSVVVSASSLHYVSRDLNQTMQKRLCMNKRRVTSKFNIDYFSFNLMTSSNNYDCIKYSNVGNINNTIIIYNYIT